MTAGGGAAVTGGGAEVAGGGAEIAGGGAVEAGGGVGAVPAGTAAATLSPGSDPPHAGIASTHNNATLDRTISSRPE